MSGKKGMPRYGQEIKEMIVQAYRSGMSVWEFEQQAIWEQSVCHPELVRSMRRWSFATRCRYLGTAQSKTENAGADHQTLTMENELLRSFLSAFGRK